MSVNPTDGWLGLGFVARQDVDDPNLLIRALLAFYREIDARPDRVTHGKAKTHAFSDKRLAEVINIEREDSLLLWSRNDGPAGDLHFFVRSAPKVREFDRRWSGVIIHASFGVRALLGLATDMNARFGLIAAGVTRHLRRPDAERESLDGGDRAKCDPALVERVDWDGWKWRRSHTKLRRLYPITIIGPEIWATLPPLPAFDPMPTVTDLGDCKVLTAWPEVCDPRDPAFLRGTRALRAWLWPYTIQNPADHVDNDPPRP